MVIPDTTAAKRISMNYVKISIEIAIQETYLWYFMECKRRRVIPTSCRIRSRYQQNPTFDRIIRKAELDIMKKTIGLKRKTLYCLKKDHIRIKNLIIESCWKSSQNVREQLSKGLYIINRKVPMVRNSLYRKLSGRINWLLYRDRANLHTRYMDNSGARKGRELSEESGNIRKPDLFLNLSSVNVPRDIERIFNLGPKMMVPFDKYDKVALISDVNSAICHLNKDDRSSCIISNYSLIAAHDAEIDRRRFFSSVHSTNNDLTKPDMVPRIKNFLRDNDLILTKADKSPHLVLLNRDMYDSKVCDFLDNNDCELLLSDPTEKVFNKVNNIRSLTHLPPFFRDHSKPPTAYKAPLLKGLIKTHKEDNPICPIIAKFTSPTYFVEKILQKSFFFLQLGHKYSTNSGWELVEQLNSFHVTPDDYIYTLDIKTLFPSVPLPFALNIFKTRILDLRVMDRMTFLHTKEFINLVEEGNYFQYEGRFYKQCSGVPMGSPLSGLLAEIMLQWMEQRILPEFEDEILIWKRYVDDILVVLHKDIIQSITTEFTKLISSIEFVTNRHSYDSEIPFLDLNLSLRRQNFEIDVFRKSINTPYILPYFAYAPYKYKSAAVDAMLLRAFQYCSRSQFLNDELDRVYKIAMTYDYPIKMLTKRTMTIASRFGRDEDNKTKKSDNDYQFRSFNFSHTTEVVAKTLRKFNINTVFRCRSLCNLFINVTPPTDITDKSGVYAIKVNNRTEPCKNTYIGRTTNLLSRRIQQHQNTIKTGNGLTTTLAEKTILGEIEPDFTCCKIIRTENSLVRLATLEAIYIYKLYGSIINKREEAVNIELWQQILKDVKLKPCTW